MPRLIATLLIFFAAVLAAGFAVIAAGSRLDGHPVALQWATSAIVAMALGLAVLLHDRLVGHEVPAGWARTTARLTWRPVLLVLGLAMGLFLLAMIERSMAGTLVNNALASSLPVSRFWAVFLGSLMFTGMVQPVIEELIFRDRLLATSSRALGLPAGALVSSLAFASIHYSHFWACLVFGMVACVLRVKLGLAYAIALHVFYNIAAVMLDVL